MLLTSRTTVNQTGIALRRFTGPTVCSRFVDQQFIHHAHHTRDVPAAFEAEALVTLRPQMSANGGRVAHDSHMNSLQIGDSQSQAGLNPPLQVAPSCTGEIFNSSYRGEADWIACQIHRDAPQYRHKKTLGLRIRKRRGRHSPRRLPVASSEPENQYGTADFNCQTESRETRFPFSRRKKGTE
jgi:hypothetical protein